MADGDAQKSDVFDEERLRRLVELMKEHDLREVELRDAEQQIRLCRAETTSAYGPPPGPPYGSSAYPPSMPMQNPSSSSVAPEGASSEADGENIVVIKSPMVGTFYIKPNPNAQPYVKVGDHVELETTVCIIEAMKVFNEIPAEVSGKIVAILADNEEAVEFGKPLFKVDTKG